jgi:hypothetical protein
MPQVMTSSPEEMDKDSFLSNNALTLGFYFLSGNGFCLLNSEKLALPPRIERGYAD